MNDLTWVASLFPNAPMMADRCHFTSIKHVQEWVRERFGPEIADACIDYMAARRSIAQKTGTKAEAEDQRYEARRRMGEKSISCEKQEYALAEIDTAVDSMIFSTPPVWQRR